MKMIWWGLKKKEDYVPRIGKPVFMEIFVQKPLVIEKLSLFSGM